MNRLGRYVLRSISWHVLLTLLVLLGLFVFFDLIAELRDVGKDGYSLQNAIVYVLLQSPERIYDLLPVSLLIGSIFALSGLADSSQITVMRAAGVSILRFCAWLTVGGVIFWCADFCPWRVFGAASQRCRDALSGGGRKIR